MKSPSYWRTIEPTFLIVPPELLLRIQAQYEKRIRRNIISHRAMKPVLDRYMHEPAFCERVHTLSAKLHDVVFDPDRRDWGDWPTDLQEAIVVGFILGIYLEIGIDDLLLKFSEEEMFFVEEQCKERSLSLAELLIDRLLESKESESWKRGEA